MADRNWNFVIAAYAVAWVVILGYGIRLWRATRRARAAYERVLGPAGKDLA